MRPLVFVFLFNFFFSGGSFHRPCAEKYYPDNFGNNLVCVCNSTYCDDIPPVGNLKIDEIAIYRTSESGDRFKKSIIRFEISKDDPLRDKSDFKIKMDTTKKFQKIFGFGGAFTDAAGINMNELSKKLRKILLEQYFGHNGIGYSVGRVPMASCDFSTREYSYDDIEGDFTLKNFALTKEDYNFKIPHILTAIKLSKGHLKLFSSPWSAPGWMKTNGRMKGGGELKGQINGKYYQVWADYFIKFFEAYAKEEIKFWGTTIQNEPGSGEDPDYGFQTMKMNATTERDFIGQLFGPALKSRNTTNDINIMICDDQRGDVARYSRTILTDPVAARYVQGIAYHWYGDKAVPASVLSSVHQQFPSFFMLMTEACTGSHNPDRGVKMGRFSRASDYAHSIIEDLQNFAVGWTDWNLCLNEEGGPNWVKNFVDSPIIVNKTSDVFYKQPMFYALGHFSKFVPRGSHRVRLVTEKGDDPTKPIEAVGFVNPENQRIVILHNPSNDNLNVAIEDISHFSQPLTLDVEAHSIVTVIWDSRANV